MSTELAKPFLWKTQDGDRHLISDMSTKHLFFTIRMVWNHSRPLEDRIEPYRRYYFSRYYTEKYIQDAVRFMLFELSSRNDMTPYFMKCLIHMKSCCKRKEIANEKMDT